MLMWLSGKGPRWEDVKREVLWTMWRKMSGPRKGDGEGAFWSVSVLVLLSVSVRRLLSLRARAARPSATAAK